MRIKNGQPSSSLSIISRRFFFGSNYFHVSRKNLESAASDRADVSSCKNRSGGGQKWITTLEFIIEFKAAMDAAFWLEEHEAILKTAVDFSLLERALLSVNDIFLWCVELADLYDCTLSVLLWPLRWALATKFSGISASSSLEIHVLRTEWLVTRFHSMWRPAFWAAVGTSSTRLDLASFCSAVLPNKMGTPIDSFLPACGFWTFCRTSLEIFRS